MSPHCRAVAGLQPSRYKRLAPDRIPPTLQTRSVPPNASALVASLRGVGYSLETAIADLVDNSIAANATVVAVNWDWNDGQPVASIVDDGHGMCRTAPR